MIFNQYPTLDVRRGAQNPRDFMNYREMTDAFETIEAAGSLFPKTLTGRGAPERIDTVGISRGLLPMLGVEPVIGRHLSESDDHTSILISHAFWRDRFAGAASALGEKLILNETEHIIVGVLPPDFRLRLPGSTRIPASVPVWNIWPEAWNGGANGKWDATAHWVKTLGRLRPGVDLSVAQAQLDAVAEYQRTDQPKRAERDATIEAVPLHSEVVGEVRPMLVAVQGGVVALLLIAALNVGNLMFVRGGSRRNELAVRAACGGSRTRLVRLLLVEAAVLAGIGAACGLGLALIGTRALLLAAPTTMPMIDNVAIDLRAVAFTAALTLGLALFVGLIPAVRSTGRSGAALPGSDARTHTGGLGRLRTTLVVAEIALSLVLLVGGGLLVRSVWNLLDEDTGYVTDRVLTFTAATPREVRQGDGVQRATWQSNPSMQAYYAELDRVFEELPGVESAASVFPTPLGDESSGSTFAPEESPELMEGSLAASLLVTPGYFDTMQIPILRGRDLTWEDDGDKLVVSESLANALWPEQEALGRRLTVGWWSGPEPGEIVGVVADTRAIQLTEPDPPTIYRAAAAYSYSPQTWVVRGRDGAAVDPAALRSAVNAVRSDVPLADVRPLSELIGAQMTKTRFTMRVIAVFGGIGLLVAAVGLYGVLATVTAQRNREIGIRLAIGAAPRGILRMVLWQGAWIAAAGLLIGAGGALAAGRVLEGILYGVPAADVWTFALCAGILFAVGLLATVVPARRAARVDPVSSLRAE